MTDNKNTIVKIENAQIENLNTINDKNAYSLIEDEVHDPDDYSDLKPEEIEQIKKMDEIISEVEDKPRTCILKAVTFKNKQDEDVFNRLPLTDIQKEELLMSIYFKDIKYKL